MAPFPAVSLQTGGLCQRPPQSKQKSFFITTSFLGLRLAGWVYVRSGGFSGSSGWGSTTAARRVLSSVALA